jgi:hypothetical protein
MEPNESTPQTHERKRWLERLSLLCGLWFHAGLWIWAGLLWLLKWWVPIAFKPVELMGGFITAFTFLYTLHYLVFTSCGPVVRKFHIPAVCFIDIIAFCGIIAALFKAY